MEFGIRQMKGETRLLDTRKIAFLCSRYAPRVTFLVVKEWIKAMSDMNFCIVCGAQSPVERQLYNLLLDIHKPVILVKAETLGDDCSIEEIEAMKEGRLLIVTHCDENVHRVSSESAFDRNRLILSIADTIVVGYSSSGGNLERLLQGRTDVTYLIEDNDTTFNPYSDYYEAHCDDDR
ncbi:MAG: hypothetical protein ACI4V5_03970 [Prevotella sp.]